MPSVNCSGVSAARGVHLDTHHRGSHVRNPIRGREDAMTATTDLAVTVWPGIEPRLLRQGAEDYADYRDAGGYQPLDDADRLLNQVDLSGVLGRGGAAFPLAVKLQTVRDNGRRGRRRGGGRQRRRGRTRVDQGPVAAAAPSAPGARRAAAGGADGGGRARTRLCVRPVLPPKRCKRRSPRSTQDVLDGLSDHGVHGRPRLRRRRRDGRGARAQRRPGQADGQAAAPVRRRRRPPADHGEQCRDACATSRSSTGTAPRRSAPGHVDVAGNVPRDDHRRGQAARRCTRFRTAWRSPSCSSSTACPPITCTAC